MTQNLIDRLSKLDGPHGLTGKELYDICRNQLGSDKALGLARTLEKALNGSVDAAIALAERVLSEWDKNHGQLVWTFDLRGNRVWDAQFRYYKVTAQHSNPAIALVMAILRAKEASNDR